MLIKRLFLILTYLVGVFSCLAKNVEVELISEGTDINLSVLPVARLGSQGLFCALNNEIIGISRSNNAVLTKVTLPDSIHVDRFISCGDKIIVQDGNKARWLSTDGPIGGTIFPDDDFDIAAATDSTFYLLRDGEIFEFAPGVSKPLQSIILPERPIGAVKFGSGTIVATANAIRLIIPEGVNVLHRHPLEIRSLALGKAGIFFCSTSDLWRLEGIDTLEHIATGSFDRIIADGPRLYLIDSKGSLYCFDYTDALRNDKKP